MSETNNKNSFDFLEYAPGPFGNLYSILTEKQKQEFKRFGAGAVTSTVTEAVELGRMLTDASVPDVLKPVTEKIYEKQEDVLQNFYNVAVGEKNVERVKRGDRTVAAIKKPNNEAVAFARDVAEFGLGLAGAGKVTKASQLFKPSKKMISPENLVIGELGTQLGVNVYEDETLFPELIGGMISEDEGILGDLKEYLEADPEERTQLQNRINLLADGLLVVGGLGVAGKAVEKLQFRQNFTNLLDTVSSKGQEAIDSFISKIETVRKNNEAVKKTALSHRKKDIVNGKVSDVGDVEALEPGAISKWISNTNLQFSESKLLRGFENLRTKLFTTRGGRTKEQHEKFLKTENIKEKWTDTITNISYNLETAINDVIKNVGTNKEDVLEQVSKVLFTDFRTPTLVTGKGISVGKTQKRAFEKELNKLPENLRQPVKEARELQDNLSKLMLETDLLTETQKKIYRDNLGFYVRRSYKLFEDPNYVPTPKVLKEAEDYLTAQIKKDEPNLSEDEILLRVNASINNILKRGIDGNTFQSSVNTFDKIRKQILNGKKEIPSPIRNLLGEIENPVQSIINSTSKLSKIIEDNKFYQQSYDDGLGIYFREEAEGIFSEVIPNGYGKLSGLHTTPEMLQYFSDYKRWGQASLENSNTYRNLVLLKGLSQAAKTVWSHTTHVKNVAGGVQMSLANGVNVFDLKQTKDIIKVLRARTSNDRELQKFHEELSERGLLNKGVIARDLQGLANDVGSLPKGKVVGAIDWTFDKIGLKKLATKAQNAYIAEDDFFKINMYIREQEYLKKFNNALPENSSLRLSDDEIKDRAARMVRDVLPNYDLVPELLQDLRRTPFFGRFFSFMAESVRISAHSVIRGVKEIKAGNKIIEQGEKEAGNIIKRRGQLRLASFTTVAGGGAKALETGSKAITGFGEDDIEAAKDFLPDYMQNANIFVSVAPDGSPMIGNISSWDAFDFPKKPFQIIINKAMSDPDVDEEGLIKDIITTTLTETVSPFLGESIIQEQLSNYILRGGRTLDGRLMKNPLDSTAQFDDSGEYLENLTSLDNLTILMGNLFESITPGTITRGRDYVETLGKEQTKWDQDIYQEQAFLKFVTGWGNQPLNKEYMENVYEFKASNFRRQKNKRLGRLDNAIGETLDVDTFTNNYLKENQKYYKEFAKFQKTTKSAERFNLNTINFMEEAGIGRKDRSAFIGKNRTFTPLGISDDLKIKLLEASKDTDDFLNALLDVEAIDRKLSGLPVIFDPENYKAQREEIEEIREELRENYKTGGLVPNVQEDPADRVDPFTGKPYAEQIERIELKNGGVLKESVRIYDEDQGLKPFFPALEILGGVGLKGVKGAIEISEQITQKALMPKEVLHGSSVKNLKEIKSANSMVSKPNEGLQSAIYTSKRGGKSTDYGFQGKQYPIDTSNISSVKNLISIGKNKVINSKRPPKKFKISLDNAIKNNSSKKEINELTRFKNSLGKQRYVSDVGPTVRKFLDDNNIKVIKTKNKLDDKPTYILIEDMVKIKGN